MDLQPMKAITLWQPWDSRVACGAKPDETRSWSIKYRGPIAIHAAKIKTSIDSIRNQISLKMTLPAIHVLEWDVGYGSIWHIFDSLPRGCIIATAELVECWKVIEHTPTAIVLKQSNGVGEDKISINDPRLPFGDYSVGRYIWGFADTNRLPESIPAKGKQGLWNWNGAEHVA